MKAKTVAVQLGGGKRTLRFDLNAVVLYEEATGNSALGGLQPRSVREFRALIWACLATEAEDQGDEPPTLRQVGAWLGEDGAMDRLYEDVVNLIAANSPAAGEGDDGPADPQAAGTGSETPTPSGG